MIFSTKKARSGLGPTMDISPLSTFQNCGSSSRRYLRINRPNGVMRSSFLEESLGPSASASIYMVLNLYMRNGLPCFPSRVWTYKTGPEELVFTRKDKYAYKGENKSITNTDSSTSRHLLICLCQEGINLGVK